MAGVIWGTFSISWGRGEGRYLAEFDCNVLQILSRSLDEYLISIFNPLYFLTGSMQQAALQISP